MSNSNIAFKITPMGRGWMLTPMLARAAEFQQDEYMTEARMFMNKETPEENIKELGKYLPQMLKDSELF